MTSLCDFLKDKCAGDLEIIIIEAKKRLGAMKTEPEVPIWVVSSEYVNLAAYPIEQYGLAVERLISEIKKEAANGGDLEIFLRKEFYKESEVQRFLEI